MTTTPFSPADLAARFRRPRTIYQHCTNRRLCYTDGVQYFANEAEAYGFLDMLGSELEQIRKVENFLSIDLVVGADGEAYFHVDDGSGNLLYSADIELPDCPPGVWQFFITPVHHLLGAENVIMLPSERDGVTP